MSERKFEIFFVTIILVFHLVLGLQCFNYCDEAFVIASGQQIFNHPESVSYIFMYYWGAFFAGVWNIFFADWGIYGFRVFNAIVITLTYYIAYRTVKPYANRWYVLAGVFLAMLAETSDITMVIHHNSVTCLFTTIAAYFLFKGLEKEKCLYFYICGIVLGINVFSRLTNIALLGLIISLIPYWIYTKKLEKILKFACLYIAGFIAGLCIVLVLMYSLGHLGLFIDVIAMLASISQDPLSGHGFSLLIPRYLYDYLSIFTIIIYMLLVVRISIFIAKHYKFNNIIAACISVLLSLFAVYMYTPLHYYFAMITLGLGYVIYRYRDNKEWNYLLTISTVIIYFQTLGGDFGIVNMHSCSVRFAIPTLFGIYGIIIKENDFDKFIKYFIFSVVLILYFKGIKCMILHSAWYDGTPRWEYTTMPKTDKANVLFKKDYACMIDDVMTELRKYSKDYNSLFVIGYMPLFNYLSGIQPYLQSCTPDFYTPLYLEKQINDAEKRHAGRLPVVILGIGKRPKVEVFDPEWDNPESMQPADKTRFYLYQNFLNKNHYKEVWRKDGFSILLPQKD